MSSASEWHARRQEEWDERHRRWEREQREREEREGTGGWRAGQPKTQSFFDWVELERAAESERRAEEDRRAAEEARRAREDLDRLLEDHVALMGGSGSVPACLATLGLGRDATTEQVKAAYRKLALVHHPDMGGDPGEFDRIKRAYDQARAFLKRRRPG
jgi:DnaJ domain